MDKLEANTVRVEIDAVHHYATPLLRAKDMPRLQALKQAVISYLRSTEHWLAKDPHWPPHTNRRLRNWKDLVMLPN